MTRNNLANLDQDTVPRSRYNCVLDELEAAKAFTRKVQADAGAEIERLLTELNQSRRTTPTGIDR